jgi:hypothetical protein
VAAGEHLGNLNPDLDNFSTYAITGDNGNLVLLAHSTPSSTSRNKHSIKPS